MILANHGIVSSSGALPSTLLNNLYAVYKAESNANDSLGTYSGTSQGGLTYTTGKSGNAFNLNGSNSAINLSTNSMNLTGDFSISAWVNLSNNYSGVNEVTLLMNLNVTSWFANPKGIHLNINNNILNFNLFDDTNTNSLFWNDSTGSIIKANSGWIHVVATRKSATGSKIYVNGVLKASNTNTIDSTYHTSFQVPTIGRRFVYDRIGNLVNNSMYAPDGTKIDELNIWTKELTQSEITDLQTKYYPY